MKPSELALRLVYPPTALCVGCNSQAGDALDWLCPDCRRALAESWIGAASDTPDGSMEAAAHAYLYGGPAGGMVRWLKYQGAHRLTERMCRDMRRAYRFIEPTGAEVVTFVPMHEKRLRRRGFNHAELLARGVAEALGLPCEALIARTRDTPQQARLPEAERRQNLDDAFAPTGDLAGRRVLLVDDVCTTGSTATACARALKAGGARAVYLLCYAAAKR